MAQYTTLLKVEDAVVDPASDGAEDLIVGVRRRIRELIGDPLLDFKGADDEWLQLRQSGGGAQHGRRIKCGPQQSHWVAVAESDQTAHHRNRHNVANGRHEIHAAITDCSVQTTQSDPGYLRLQPV